MDFISQAFNGFKGMHPILKLGIAMGSALLVRQIGSKINRQIFSIPDGPEGFPLVGIIPYILTESPLKFIAYKLCKYGPIVCYSLGLQRVILINDPILAKKIYSNPITLHKQIRGTSHANPVSLLNGTKWRNRRRMLHTVLTSSLNTSFVENGTKTYFKDTILNIINKNCEDTVALDLSYILKPLTFNVLFYSVFGRYLNSLNDPFWNDFKSKTAAHTKNTFIRMMKSSIYGETGWIDYEWNDLLTFLQDYVQKNNLLSLAPKDSIYYKLKNDNDISDIEIISEILGLFIGAIEATATTMNFSILLLCKYPNIQNKIYNELKSIQGNDDIGISLNSSNLVKMSCFRAFVHETMRLYPVSVNTGPRNIRKSFNIDAVSACGRNKRYCIPKNSLLLINTIGIARNQKYWIKDGGDSNINMDEIHLDFWLNNDGKFSLNKDAFTLFSIGRRDCVGRAIALKQIYIILSCLILKYKFYVNDPRSFKVDAKLARGPLIPLQSSPVFVSKR